MLLFREKHYLWKSLKKINLDIRIESGNDDYWK